MPIQPIPRTTDSRDPQATASQPVIQKRQQGAVQVDQFLASLKKHIPHGDKDAPHLYKDRDNSAKVEKILDARQDGSRPPTPDYYQTGPMPMLPPNWGDAKSSAELLVDGLPDNERDQKLKELNRPLAAAQYLLDNWGKWHLGKDPDLSELLKNPPKDMPQEGRDMLKYIEDHPSLKNAMDVANAHGANPDGKISKQDVQAFIGHYKDQQEAGAKAFEEWKSNNRDAGEIATELARSGAVLIANEALLHGADWDVPGDKHPLASLKGTAELSREDFGFVSDAAQLFARGGMFAQIDRAGVNIATHDRDRLFNVDNMKKWLKNDAPKNDQEAMALFEKAALHTAIDTMNGDTSQIKGDLFTKDKDGKLTLNKDKYSDAQCAAALIELQDARAKLTAGAQQGLYREKDAEKYGINPNPDKLAGDLDARIALLANDEGISQSMAQRLENAYLAIGKANPLLKEKIENHFKNYVENGQGLKDAADGKLKGPDGKTLSLGDGLSRFISQAGTMAKMLGKPEPDLPEILKKPELADARKKIHDSYIKDVVDGDIVGRIMKDNPKMDVEEAIARAGRESIAITAATDPRMVEMHKDLQNKNFTERANAALVGNTDMSKIAAQFTNPDGSLNEAKMEEVFKKMQEANPDLFVGKDGKSMAPDILKAIRGAWDGARNGSKVADVLTKDTFNRIMGDYKNNNALDSIYKNGLMHGVSAVFGAFALTARASDKKDPNATDIANYMGSALAVIGTGIESGTKYYQTKVDDKTRKDSAKKLEQAGKMLGGAGNIIAGVTSIISGASQLKTDKANGAVNITSGSLFTAAGTLSIAEGAATLLAPRFAMLTGLANVTGAASGALGVVGAAFAVGVAIWQLVEMAIKDNKIAKDAPTFWKQLDPVLERYGATGGPVEPGDKKSDNEPKQEGDPYWVYYPV